MKNQFRIYILIILFGAIIRMSAKTVDAKFEHIPIGIAFCFLQDSNGFLWIGSQEGLARYDGHNLKFYTQIPFDSTSLSNNWVTEIKEDIRGNLWVGTYGGGLNYFNQRTEIFEHYFQESNREENIVVNEITSMILNDDGTLWIGSKDKGLIYMSFDSTDNAVYKTYNLQSSDGININAKGNSVWSLLKDSKNKLWIGTMEDGLIYFDPDTENIQHYKYDPNNPNGIRSNLVTSICEDDSGTIWFATGHIISDIAGTGLGKFDPETHAFTYYTHDPNNSTSICSNSPFCLFIDKSQTLWIGSNDKGICSVPLEQFYSGSKPNFTKYKGLKSDIINQFYEDKFGSIWIGMWAVYMARFDRRENPFNWYHREYGNSNSLSSSGIECIFIDRSGIIWFGHHFTGVSKYDPETGIYKHYKYDPNDENGISSNWINAICEDNEGKLWFGTIDNGIDIFDPINESFAHIKADTDNKHGLRSNQIRFLLKSQTGDIWISTWNDGLQMFNKVSKQFTYFDIDTNTTADETTSGLFEDSRGTLWIGTMNSGFYGLSMENEKINEIKHYTHNPKNRNSLSNNSVTDIIQSNSLDSNFLWIATNVGLNKFDLNTETFTHYFKQDGLPHDFVLNLMEDKQGNIWAATPYKLSVYNIKTDKFNTYSKNDGLPFTGFGGARQNSAVTHDGQLLFGSGRGALGFIPEKVMMGSNSSKIYFTDLKIFGETAELDTAINFKKIVELGYYQNAVSFEFTDLNFSPSDKNQFAYKLGGLYENWINIGDERKVTFTNLDPGEYLLSVKVADNQKTSNETEASMLLIIKHPWWAAWWFRSIMLISFAALIYGLYKYRVNRLLEMESMRIQIASDLHDDVGASLTKIAVHSEIIQNTQNINKITTSSVKIGSMSREIITSLSDIIWSIDSRNDKVGDLIDRMRDYLDTVFPTGSITTNFQTHGLLFENNITQELRQNIYLIFKEAVNNAAKHSGATEVKITMTNGSGKLRLEISDNGKGLELDERSSGHHGLQNMKLRAERIKGELKIEVNKGTKIILIVKEL